MIAVCKRVATGALFHDAIIGVIILNAIILGLETSSQVMQSAGVPLVVLNGPEFTSRSLDQWAYARGVELDSIRPGKPTDNATIESFNGKLRTECLNQNWFLSLTDAQEKLDAWRLDYNRHRPHSALGNLAPNEFAETCRKTRTA